MRDSQIADLLRPHLAEFDLELEAVEIIPAGKRRLLRVVVDGDGPDGTGPTLDDIAEASKVLSGALDSADIAGASPYTLEVSSRGVSRPLVLPRHWRRNVGRLVAVKTAAGEQFNGRVVSTADDAAVLNVDGVPRTVQLSEVETALVQVELNRPVVDKRD
jgi:ribosome maturation factor RimP